MIDFVDRLYERLLEEPLADPLMALCQNNSYVFNLGIGMSREHKKALHVPGVYCFWILKKVKERPFPFCYVGQSKNIWRRWNQHLSCSNAGYGELSRFRIEGQKVCFIVLDIERDYWERKKIEDGYTKILVPGRVYNLLTIGL